MNLDEKYGKYRKEIDDNASTLHVNIFNRESRDLQFMNSESYSKTNYSDRDQDIEIIKISIKKKKSKKTNPEDLRDEDILIEISSQNREEFLEIKERL